MDNAAIMRLAKSYAKDHLTECCEEIIEWRSTSVLREGRVRELAKVLRPLVEHDALGVAESLVVRAAMDRIAGKEKG